VILILLRDVPARVLLAMAACLAAVASAAAVFAALMYCQQLRDPAWVLACLWACQQPAVLLLLCLLCQMLAAGL
jgi:hypothetical protein